MIGTISGKSAYQTSLYNSLSQGINNIFNMLINRQMKINSDKRQRRMDPSGMSSEQKNWEIENLKLDELRERQKQMQLQTEGMGYDNIIKGNNASDDVLKLNNLMLQEGVLSRALGNEMEGYRLKGARNDFSDENLAIQNEINKSKADLAKENVTSAQNSNALNSLRKEAMITQNKILGENLTSAQNNNSLNSLRKEAMITQNKNAEYQGEVLKARADAIKSKALEAKEIKDTIDGYNYNELDKMARARIKDIRKLEIDMRKALDSGDNDTAMYLQDKLAGQKNIYDVIRQRMNKLERTKGNDKAKEAKEDNPSKPPQQSGSQIVSSSSNVQEGLDQLRKIQGFSTNASHLMTQKPQTNDRRWY